MTSTTYTGFMSDKPSSRGRAPPSHNIFGGYDETSSNGEQKKENIRPPISNVFGAAKDEQPQQQKKATDNVKSLLFGEQQVNAVGKKKRTGINPITGQRYEEEEDAEDEKKKKATTDMVEPSTVTTLATSEKPAPSQAVSSVHTSSKVLQPPGGRCTKLW